MVGTTFVGSGFHPSLPSFMSFSISTLRRSAWRWSLQPVVTARRLPSIWRRNHQTSPRRNSPLLRLDFFAGFFFLFSLMSALRSPSGVVIPVLLCVRVGRAPPWSADWRRSIPRPCSQKLVEREQVDQHPPRILL